MEMNTHAVAWIEIPVTDFERARRFYSRIYDYDMPSHAMGGNLMGFLLFDQASGIGGAIVKGDGYVPSASGALVYLSGGKDLSAVLGRVEAAGGKVLRPKTEIAPGLGFAAEFMDVDGNRLGLHSRA